jgi:uncharacterized protein YkwD
MIVKFILLSFWSLIISVSQAADLNRVSDVGEMTQEEAALVTLTNQERKRAGLRPLRMNLKLMQAAREHSAHMAQKEHLSHTLGGEDFLSRINRTGYPFSVAAENIAMSSYPLSHVVHMWMRSPGHRKNILNSHVAEIGVGICKDAKGDRYLTQIFAKKR